VRLRGVYVSPDTTSKLGAQTAATYGAGIVAAGAKLDVDGNAIPEIDFSYYITKNIAAELILATGTRHNVKIKNSTGSTLNNQNLGTVNLLPPTLTLQWHFMPDQMFDPYVGGGMNFTLFMDKGLNTQDGTNLPIKVEQNSFGGVLQAGLDVNLKDGWMINADVKKVWINTDVTINGSTAGLAAGYRKIDSLDIDPWVFGFGIGKRF
jgi:outer membrane protein